MVVVMLRPTIAILALLLATGATHAQDNNQTLHERCQNGATYWCDVLKELTRADNTVYFGACLVLEVPEGVNNCVVLTAPSFEACTVARKLAMERNLMVSQCSRSEEAVKAELNKLWKNKS